MHIYIQSESTNDIWLRQQTQGSAPHTYIRNVYLHTCMHIYIQFESTNDIWLRQQTQGSALLACLPPNCDYLSAITLVTARYISARYIHNCIYIYIYLYIYIYSCMHVCHIYIYIYIYICMYVCIYTYIHTCLLPNCYDCCRQIL